VTVPAQVTARVLGDAPKLPADGCFRLDPSTARELCSQPDSPESDRLLGPLVVRGGRTIVVGDTGHGKTSIVAQMTRATVAGERFLDWTGAGRVRALMIDLEQGLRSIKRGLREAGLADSDDVFYVSVPDGLALDSDDEHLAEVIRIVEEIRPALLTLDPYYKAHRADDPNGERVVVDLMRRLDSLRSRYGFALILPAHPRKDVPGRNGARKLTLHDVAGSGAVVRGAEVVIAIERLSHGCARLRYLKDRDGELPVGESVALLFSPGDGFRLDPRETESQEQLEESARETGADGEWRTSKEWSKALGVGEARAKALLDALTQDGAMEFAEGPTGRSPKAKCWRTAPDPSAQSNAVTQSTPSTDPNPGTASTAPTVSIGAVGESVQSDGRAEPERSGDPE
jgi:hypothetical protein